MDEFEDEFSLTLLLLLFAEALGVLELRDGSDGEGHVVGDALGIILDASDEMLVDGLSDQNEFCLHDECLANIYIYSVYLKLVSHGDAYANVVLSHVEHCHATKQVTEEFI